MCESIADVDCTVTTGHVMSMDELANVKGRGWEDIDVSTKCILVYQAGITHTNSMCIALSARLASAQIAVLCVPSRQVI